jgi:adenylate kinase
MRLVLLGAPGAGKGTQAKIISEKFRISHISTGDILRNEMRNGTDLGKKAREFVTGGKLVPDELIIEIIKKEINKPGADTGFLMDGFPRNLKQAVLFEDMLSGMGVDLDKVIYIDVDNDELVKRLGSRRTCSSCNNIYSVDVKKKEDNENSCPRCGGELIKRKDDDPEVISERLNIYNSETRPLIDFYESKKLLIKIKGNGSQGAVTERVLKDL